MFTISRQCLYLMPCTLAQDEERCKYYFQNLFFPGFHEIFQVVLVEMQDAIEVLLLFDVACVIMLPAEDRHFPAGAV